MQQQQKRLSDAVAQPLISAYRAGGLGLTLLVLGSILLAWSGDWLAGISKYLILALGLALIALPCMLFYVEQIRPIARAQRTVGRHRETIDSVQDMAVALTELTMQMQALAFKHAEDVDQAIAAVRPILDKIPGLNRAGGPLLERAENVSQAIVSSTNGTQRVLHEVKEALIASDPALIKDYLARVTALRERTTQLLAAPNTTH